MTVTTSYPGLYIQELPSSSHAILPAPTSIAAFVGYSHPYKTTNFGIAQQIFSFTDYETYFGGLFTSGATDASLPRAVYQFFLNGGSNAYVVGLQPSIVTTTGTTVLGPGGKSPSTDPVATDADGFVFTALEPIDIVPMSVTITNVRTISGGTANGTFDVIITYGNRVETFRGITLSNADSPTNPDNVINGKSTLVTVAPGAANGKFGTALKTVPPGAITFHDVAGATDVTGFNAADFLPVFAANSSLDNVEIFNLLLVPGVADNEVVSAALSFAERKRAFAILDPPPGAPASGASSGRPSPMEFWMTGLGGQKGGYVLPTDQNGALYFPYLVSTDPITGNATPMPPSGFVAGIYAKTDNDRGVWKAPAGLATVVLNTTGPVASGQMNDPQQGVLNLDSINCLRTFSGVGTVVWGARTLVASNQAFQQSMYVPVRRMTLFIEQTLRANLRWVVFEPNDEPLWTAIKTSIEAFMLSLFRQGALQGEKPSDAFQVKCDSSTTTGTDQQNGIVNIIVAFAPLKPAEFVVIKIAQLAGQTAGA